MKKKLSLFAALITCAVFVFAFSPAVLAVEFSADSEVFISEPMFDDTYLAGGMISVDNDITGDLYIAGGNVTINGNVEGDLVIGAGDITVNGDVSDDLRVAGGNISVNGNVGDDLIATGGRLDVSSGTLIGGSLIIGNGYANILGTVNEDIKGGGGRIVLGGIVYRDVELEIQDTLMLNDNARINGNLIYTSLRAAELTDEQVAGYIEFDKRIVEEGDVGQQVQSFFTKFHLIFLVFKYLSLLVLALVLVVVAPKCLAETAKVAIKNPWRSLGVGFIVAVCAIAASIILVFTVIGIPLAAIIIAVFAITMYVAKIYAGAFIGNALIKPKKMTKGKLFGITALGLFIFMIVDIVPIVGWIASLIIFFIAFGALWTHKKALFDKLGLQKLS